MPIRIRTLTTAAILAVASLATVTACSSSGGSDASGDSTPTPMSASSPGGATGTVGQNTSGSNDVKVDTCSVDATTRMPSAALTVTNHGTDTATYLVQLEFVDSGGTRLAEGPAIVHSLGAGQQAKETAGGTAQVTTDFTCKLTKVQRLAGM
ncbi:hypothetical protein ABZX85_16085 [Streptomyces sp. NPDC004539]|uniref:hypothetical protein n=1 Tax=Streptomyces sp. NPDC004539 TaxID=3154280 RepID=UPI0033AA627A